MKAFIISLIDSFLWRVRGGWRIPNTDKKVPLNKIWFAVAFGIEAGLLRGWDWALVITTMIATYVSYQAYGWGEAVSCVCGVSEGNPDRRDCELIDDIMDNAKITIKGTTFKLADFPILWGWCWLSLRGLIMTFIIGLALRSVPFMLCGLGMGTVYYIGGLIARKILKKFDKTGWDISEFGMGMYLAICLCLFA